MQLRQSIFMQLIPRCHLRRSYFHATPFHFRPILLHNFAPQQFLHIIHSVVYDTQACGCVNYSVGYDVFNILTFIVTQRPLGVCLVCTLSPISATLCVSSVHWTSHMCYLGSNATKCWWWTPSDPKSYGCQRAAVVAVVGVQEARTVSLAAGSVHAWLEMDIFLPRSKRNTTSVFFPSYFGWILLKYENVERLPKTESVHYLLGDSCPRLASDGHVSAPIQKARPRIDRHGWTCPVLASTDHPHKWTQIGVSL